MKRLFIGLMLLLSSQIAVAQHALTYQSYAKGVTEQDTTSVQVMENSKLLKIRTEEKLSNPIPGFAESNTYVDYAEDSVYTIVDFTDAKYYSSFSFTDNDVVFSEEGEEKMLGYDCKKYKK